MASTIAAKRGRASRTKGHSFEREIAARMREVYPNARRQLEYHTDDAKGRDIQCTGRLAIQCKRFKTYAPITAIFEVQIEPMLGDVPMLVTAGDRQPAMAVLPFEDFLRLLKASDWY